jgi:hypothetical protein
MSNSSKKAIALTSFGEVREFTIGYKMKILQI